MPFLIFPTLAAEPIQLLGTTDYVVIAVYLAGIIIMGSLFARGQKNSEDYFLASRRMHWFPLALSIWASLTSANSMLGAPSYGYSQDLQQVLPVMLIGLAGAVFVIYLILPLLHGLHLTTAYTYLERRYGLIVRCGGSLLFMLLRGGWLASVIYVPSLALSAVIPIEALDEHFAGVKKLTGISGSTFFWIVVVGLGATIYTTLGGLKAVIWTDVVQFFVFVVGMGAIWFMLIGELPDGLRTLYRELGHVPRAYFGEDRDVSWDEHVVLDGSESRAFQEGVSLRYQWNQIDIGPNTPEVELHGGDTSRPNFRAPSKPERGRSIQLRFRLWVTTNADLPLQSPPAVVTITVRDPVPSMVATPMRQEPPASHDRPHDTWFDLKWHLVFGSGVTFWMLMFSTITGRINDAGTDQVALQRYFSASSIKDSRRAIWVNAICDVPLMPLLFLTGAGVLVFYAVFPNPDLPLKPSQAMPFFVADKLNDLVPGLSGLFIAALFAATMSSVDSGINSLSATVVTDWYRRLMVTDKDERHYLNAARLATLILGLAGTIAALFLGKIGEAWQIAVSLMGFFTGPLLGIFLLGFFTTRTNAVGVLIGATVGMICTVLFSVSGGNEYLYAMVGLIPTLVVGYIASAVAAPPRPDQLHQLTLWTRKSRSSTP